WRHASRRGDRLGRDTGCGRVRAGSQTQAAGRGGGSDRLGARGRRPVGDEILNDSADFKGSRPAYARWLRQTNNITQQFLAIGGQADFVSLAGGLPAAELYPVEEMRAAADRALTRWGSRALEYGPVEGFPDLRAAVAERMSRMAGRRLGVENIL